MKKLLLSLFLLSLISIPVHAGCLAGKIVGVAKLSVRVPARLVVNVRVRNQERRSARIQSSSSYELRFWENF